MANPVNTANAAALKACEGRLAALTAEAKQWRAAQSALESGAAAAADDSVRRWSR